MVLQVLIRVVLAVVIANTILAFGIVASKGLDPGALGGEALWHGFVVLLCLTIWRRTGRKNASPRQP